MITAGLPRQPGMSRDDLVQTNEKIVKSVTEQVVARVAGRDHHHPLEPARRDVPRREERLGLPKERVFGQAGILDTARYRTFIAWETGASVKDVQALVLGGHGDQMVPVVSATTVGGVPLRKLVSEERIQAMVERTAVGGGEIVKLLGTSAWYAPGAAVRADGRLGRCSTRSACFPAPRTSRASTGSTASTWACRSSSAARASSRSRGRPRRASGALAKRDAVRDVVGVLTT